MTDDTAATPITPQLVAFEPCTGWWAHYDVQGTRNGEPVTLVVRKRVAGWGVWRTSIGVEVLAMTDGGSAHLFPVDDDKDSFSGLWSDEEHPYCQCARRHDDPTDRDVDDPHWCRDCPGLIP